MSEAHAHDHAHGHTHGHGTHAHAPTSDAVALRRALALTLSVLVVEAVGGLLTNSVALLADAGHMLTDAGALAIALFAAWGKLRSEVCRVSEAHAHDHAHGHGTHAHAHAPSSDAVALRRALALTLSVLVVEAVGGLLTNSVALLADAGHMLTDAGALAIALFAAWASTRPRRTRHSFGYGRAEVLAALLNGLLLGGVSVGVGLESFARLAQPREVAALPMLGIAAIGLAANLVSGAFLMRGARSSLNVRAALYHVGADALGSVAAMIAAAAIWLLGWTSADAVAGVAIAGLLVISALRLIRDSVDILLEGAPRHLDLDEIASQVIELPGVARIHDLHIWTVGSGFPAMSAHVDLLPGADAEAVRRAVHRLLHQEYSIAHTTIQTESAPPLLQVETPPL